MSAEITGKCVRDIQVVCCDRMQHEDEVSGNKTKRGLSMEMQTTQQIAIELHERAMLLAASNR